jgi:hypothetical protein
MLAPQQRGSRVTERRADQVLAEWRALERRVASNDAEPGEQRALARRIAELRAEYRQLSRPADASDAPVPLGDAADRPPEHGANAA